MRYLAAPIAIGLLVQMLAGEIWQASAALVYGGFLVVCLGLAFVRWRPIWLLASLWAQGAILLYTMGYTPSGFTLPSKVLLVLLLIFLTPRRTPPWLVSIASVTLAVLLTFAVDRAMGGLALSSPEGGLLFPPGTHMQYETVEFNHSVQINRYGFRGPSLDLEASVDCRVVLLGDSFTYGWGVDYEQTWGALIEGALHAEGLNVQVLNLGMPGANPPDYAAIAQVALPLLEPDVVLVGVLQGDDMRQMSRSASAFPRSLTFGESVPASPWHEFIRFQYPNLPVRLAKIQPIWASSAATFIAQYTPEQRNRYNALDAELRGWFESGQINPHFLNVAVVSPDYFAWPLQAPDRLTPYIDMLAQNFRDINSAASGAHVQVVSVPHGIYTQPQMAEASRRLGFILAPEIVESPLVDDAIEVAANLAGVPFSKATQAFRQSDALAFYPVDGHFNAAGNRLLAQELLPYVRSACQQSR